ncbi:MAG: chromosomal replication initiator protein DnaA, partial [Rhodothermales bacterium]|nr:chromosomal replication initiator protein DnaA [Rhodothermales bacterium]
MTRKPDEVWNECLDVFRDVVDPPSFKIWFEPIRAISLETDNQGSRLTVRLPSPFFYEWLEQHYPRLIRKTIKKVLGPDGRLVYDVVIEQGDDASGYGGSGIKLPARQDEAEIPTDGMGFGGPDTTPSDSVPHPIGGGVAAPPAVLSSVYSNLNPAYTFDRFVEGDCNRLARSASVAIAKQPGKTSFNPFMIYGGVGLGKTHLMQAIGNYAKSNDPLYRILYVSSERFTTEFVQAIQHNRVSDFTVFYQSVDLLVIDDAQFFAGKEKTQEEFFHIFNALHQAGKQIVLSADRPPRDIEGIEERLLSRFQWGLSADMQPPDLETRIAILQRKAEDDGLAIDRDVIEFIAHNVKSNIRELEGALIRLLAFSTLNKREIELVMAKEVLRDL